MWHLCETVRYKLQNPWNDIDEPTMVSLMVATAKPKIDNQFMITKDQEKQPIITFEELETLID